MKNVKKVLLLVLCAVLLVSATIAGTVAYLTSQDTVVNTFTVGQVKIELDEAKVGEDGRAEENGDRVNGNEYHLLPGMSYDKDPTVTVLAGSEEAYIRMLVKVTNINKLEEVFDNASYYGADKTFLLQKLVGGWDPEIWVYKSYAADGADGIYEFRYNEPVDAEDDENKVLEALFETITIPGEGVNNDNIKKLAEVKIEVLAQAIQAAGFTNADAAWAAFGN